MTRPLPWIGPALTAVVLVGALYGSAIGLYPDARNPWRIAAYTMLLLLFALLDHVERRWMPPRPAVWAVALALLVRLGIIGAASALDGSGASRILLFMLPILASFWVGRWASVAIAVACFAIAVTRLAIDEPGWAGEQPVLMGLLMFAVGLAFTVILAESAVAERRARLLAEGAAALQARLAVAEDRARIARDIHDGLGHHLTAVSIQLEKAQVFRLRDPGLADAAVADARASAGAALEEVRRSVSVVSAGPRPLLLLDEELRGLASAGPHGLVEVTVIGDVSVLGQAQSQTIARVAQEAVTNVLRHAAAEHASVHLSVGADSAELVIADDGVGIEEGASAVGFGVRGMRERVHSLGGELRIDSTAGGTVVAASVPLGSP